MDILADNFSRFSNDDLISNDLAVSVASQNNGTHYDKHLSRHLDWSLSSRGIWTQRLSYEKLFRYDDMTSIK